MADDASRGTSSRCLVCSAQATGYHFEAQSCSACAAFFRRTVALRKCFECITGRKDCVIHYTMHQMCRCCRYSRCIAAGMNTSGVQPRRSSVEQRRAFCTKSGLKRNKKFSQLKPQTKEELQQAAEVVELSRVSSNEDLLEGEGDSPPPEKKPIYHDRASSQSSYAQSPLPSFIEPNTPDCDVLTIMVKEEMRLGERRRILFCERPVEKLLGQNQFCPFTPADIRPLSFRAFRKSIRTHILLIYEWLQAWPEYHSMPNTDKVSFLRKCVLFHTILDPVYISIQIGYPDKFVMQNGGFVSCVDGCEDGWRDEKEISGEIKRHIYQPLLKKIMAEIIPPWLQLQLSFEEFVALKAFVSFQGAIPNASLEARDAMRRFMDSMARSLHRHYIEKQLPAAERMGSIILLLSSIFSTGLDFVESHRQIEFFDLWHLDSLLLQFLNLDTILSQNNQGLAMKTKLNINRFHWVCFFIWQAALLFCCQQIFPIFYNLTPTQECTDPGFKWSKVQCSLSEKDQCDELKNCSSGGIVTEKPVFRSMAQEFDLLCGDAYYATLVSTIQFLGVLFGTVIYGHLGDHFGRKPVSMFGIIMGMAFGVASGFAPNWQVFAAFRFICGTSIACILVVFYTYILEMILPEQRVFLRSFFNWGYARVIFTFVCWLTGWWRSAAMATALLPLPVVPIVLIFFPESPKWYQTKKRHEEAKKAEDTIRRLSGLATVKEEKEVEENKEKRDTHVYTMKDLFSERQLGINTIILGILWFCTSLSAFGSDLNSGNLAGSFYVTQFVSGLVTAFAKIFIFFFDTYWPTFDRRRLHQLPQVLMILCYGTLMVLILLPDTDCDEDSWRDWAVVIVNIVGVSLIEITWDACYLVAAEVFPTRLRTVGVGTCSLLARIGALVAPQMAYLSQFSPSAPYAVVVAIGILSLLISIFFLPNTKGVDLGDTQTAPKEEEQTAPSLSLQGKEVC